MMSLSSCVCKVITNGSRSRVCNIMRYKHGCYRRHLCSLATPVPDGETNYSPKLHSIAQDIAGLTLHETVQLTELLKKTLNISDIPMMAAPVAATGPTDGADTESAKEQQTEFTVKLVKYSDDSKIKLIKKMKELLSGLNLVQAKKLVESVPQIIKENVSKEEAEKLKAEIESQGGSVEIE